MNMSKHKIELIVSDGIDPDNSNDPDDEIVAYLKLPDYPIGEVTGCVKKTMRLLDFVQAYKGSDVYFDQNDMLIGIEILS